ncbi:hypothetical protein A5772_13955 [Mycolicibacter sinensis]|uniref:Uncharacterized protein n=1 Tax=Mycolicibacter sinensis (strain JDM601) TaxID=875328 RepID=A0A1A2E875_MYCSD|nr:hypothetical protein A5772_13955 [Mycolicibacter sinensis]OBG00976.1 hypothetical protein A5771_18110 [Mycolicibacter sinensis]
MAVAVLAILALASGSLEWAVAIAVLAAVGFGGYVLLPRIAEQQAAAAERRDAIRERADRQHSWALRGDSRGLYGADGAEVMRRIADAPNLDDIADDSDDEPAIAAVAYTPEDLSALLAERPACWRYAAFVSVLVQRRATLLSRLRDQQLGYAPKLGMQYADATFSLAQRLSASDPPGGGTSPLIIHISSLVSSTWNSQCSPGCRSRNGARIFLIPPAIRCRVSLSAARRAM